MKVYTEGKINITMQFKEKVKSTIWISKWTTPLGTQNMKYKVTLMANIVPHHEFTWRL